MAPVKLRPPAAPRTRPEVRISGGIPIKPSILAALAIAAAPLPGWAQSPAAPAGLAGRNLAAACANCHAARDAGAGGQPVLRGRPREFLAQTLKDFRDGRRSGTIMPQLARGYDDRQIAAVAEWLAAQAPQ